jgi:hypothetical protein
LWCFYRSSIAPDLSTSTVSFGTPPSSSTSVEEWDPPPSSLAPCVGVVGRWVRWQCIGRMGSRTISCYRLMRSCGGIRLVQSFGKRRDLLIESALTWLGGLSSLLRTNGSRMYISIVVSTPKPSQVPSCSKRIETAISARGVGGGADFVLKDDRDRCLRTGGSNVTRTWKDGRDSRPPSRPHEESSKDAWGREAQPQRLPCLALQAVGGLVICPSGGLVGWSRAAGRQQCPPALNL